MRSEQNEKTPNPVDLEALRRDRLVKLLHEANENREPTQHPVLAAPPGVRRQGM